MADEKSGSFWATIPGMLTGLAALIAAGTSAYVTIQKSGPAAPAPVQAGVAAPAPTPAPLPTAATAAVAPAPLAATETTELPAPSAALASRPMGSLHRGIRYGGSDLKVEQSASAVDCARLCFDDAQCVAISYARSTHQCHFKGAVQDVGRDPDIVSARRLP